MKIALECTVGELTCQTRQTNALARVRLVSLSL